MRGLTFVIALTVALTTVPAALAVDVFVEELPAAPPMMTEGGSTPALDQLGDLVGIGEPAIQVDGRHIVGFHEMIDVSSGYYAGQKIVDFSDNLAFVTVEVTDFATFEAHTLTDANVKYTEAETLMTTMYTPNDPFWSTSDYQWGAKQIVANIAWDKTLGTTATKLCILDTGLYKAHEEFTGQSRILQGRDTVFEDNDPNDGHGHGTHVTGIASATLGNAKGMAGIAQVTIIPIRVLDAQGSGTPTDIAQGLDFCRTSGGHIASMSLGGSSSTTIQNAVVAFQNAGGLVIAAAGNSGCACLTYPAAYANVMGVGATTKTNAKASFSQTGSHVDIAAPGVTIVSTYKDTTGCTATKCYVYMDGTSMATPFVSGVAALVKSKNPTFTSSQITSRLTSTAQDLGTAGRDNSFGYGLVRADLAVY